MTVSATSIIKKLLLLFLVFAGLHFAADFLMPLSIGGVLATLFLPFCRWMEKRKVPKFLAPVICLLVLLLFVAGVGGLIGWQVSELAKDITLIKQRITEVSDSVQAYIFTNVGIEKERQMQLLKDQQSMVTEFLASMAGSLTTIITSFILVLVYIFGLLYYRSHIKEFLLKLAPPAQRKEMENIVYNATNVSQQYLVGLTKMIICLWIMYSIGFSLAGVKNAIFFAILCGLLEIVPFIGNITGTSITVLVAAVHGANIATILSIIGTYAFVQFIQGWVLEPIIVGPQVKINPFATIIALIIGELVWGIPGIILAIPLTAMLKIVCDHIQPLKPYGFLIGELESAEKEPGYLSKLKAFYKKWKK